MTSVELEPVRQTSSIVALPPRQASPIAPHAGQHGAYFMDDPAYAEPGGFWVAGGARRASLLLSRPPVHALMAHGTTRQIFLRNVPVENTVTIEVGAERHEVHLAPREETAIEWPAANRERDVVLRIQPARRASLAARSRQRRKRFLGCWVEIR